MKLRSRGKRSKSPRMLHNQEAILSPQDGRVLQARTRDRPGVRGLLVFAVLVIIQSSAFSQTRWHQMDVGPFFSATFTPQRAGVAGFTHKGIAIRLSRKPGAAACFDTELLRMSTGWEGAFSVSERRFPANHSVYRRRPAMAPPGFKTLPLTPAAP